MGDNIYARPFIREAARKYDLYLETPWPELFEDLPVRFVRAERKLRTQIKNVVLQPASRWSVPPKSTREVKVGYGGRDLEQGSIVLTLEKQFAVFGSRPGELVFDLPDMGPCHIERKRPIAFVRPVTIRAEWRNEARNPKPEYINGLAAAFRATHDVILVADLLNGQEWIDGPAPPHDLAFLSGELSVRQLLALFAAADVVIGGAGWVVPAAVATRVRSFIVLGGHGGHNAPERITDKRMDLTRIGFAMPDRFCRCNNMMHRCDKTISNISEQFDAFAQRTGLAVPRQRAA